jgi:hypothetical protein
MNYDSEPETQKHINRVIDLSNEFIYKIIEQIDNHDNSKLCSPEKQVFDAVTPKLKGVTYGSDQYKEYLREIKPALDHHYKENSHHPEHFDKGIAGMSFIDLIEMFCDWKAASERHADGSFERSIQINAKRFNMDPQLVSIFENTRKLFKL